MPYRPSKKKYLYLVFVSAALIVLHYTKLSAPVEIFLRSIVTPTLSSLTTFSINVGDRYQVFKNREEFVAAYQACLATAARQAADTTAAALLAQENNELRQLLAWHKKQPVPMVVANVIGKELLTTGQKVLIDQGVKAGLAVDQPVITQEGVLVGKILKVEPDIATVRLINDNQSKMSAVIFNRDRSLGAVEGGYGISLRMNLIPRDEPVRIGDQVVSSGLEGTIPRGLIIGTVAVIENEPYKPFQQAVLTPATDLSKLTVVSALLTR
ncbi:MAG: rod shape-determining protein MreC [Candidatus Magasanikbacteria bacterium]|nr:rod shape-determining protein MreC [Candidatus Magasanikbacteria bacterium]